MVLVLVFIFFSFYVLSSVLRLAPRHGPKPCAWLNHLMTPDPGLLSNQALGDDAEESFIEVFVQLFWRALKFIGCIFD